MSAKLLERISQAQLIDDNRNFSLKAVDEIASALIKIIELHSPEGNSTQQCKHCKRFYPCPTIEIANKELQ